MMDIKLIALDLDGTLLDSQKRLSRKNEEVLRKCAERGIEIVPCTGRIWRGIPDFIRNLPGVHYAITVNGAVVEDVQHGCTLSEKKFETETAMDLVRLARKFFTMYDAYIDGKGYGEAYFIDHMEAYGVPGELKEMILQTRNPVPDLMEYIREQKRPVEKLNYFFKDPEERLRAKAALLARDDVVVSSSFSCNLEINALGATKGDGIVCLANHLGIDPACTMGFGDGENDLTMMTKAGIGVAMANGMEAAKNAADYITLSNDEDGVAAALEHFLPEICG
jgi:hypothetical protein